MQNLKQIKWNDAIIMLLGSAIAAYVVLKALCLGITDDEAWSYYNVKRFWYVETLCTGNTHWFNFLAIKAALLLGLEKAWQLRWFSVLSGLIFVFIGISWVKELKHVSLKVLAFSFLFFNTYLLDYLSLARGYATGLAFMGLSLLYMYKSFQNHKNYNAWGSALFFAGLSAIANFNFFYFFSAFCVVYFFQKYFDERLKMFKSKAFYISIGYVISISFLVLRALLFITECSNDIGGCGGESFIESIFGSFVTKGFLSEELATTVYAKILSFLFFTLMLVTSIFGLVRHSQHQNYFYTTVSGIFLLMLGLTVFNKYFFNVLYPIHRTTLMFYPFYVILSVYFLMYIKLLKMRCQVIAYSVSALLVIHFIINIDLKKNTDYSRQADSREVYQTLVDLNARRVGICPELYVLYLKYYSQVYPLLKGEMINTIMPIPVWLNEKQNQLEEFEYLILYPPYNLEFYKKNKIKLEGIKLFSEQKTLLVKVLKS